MNQRRWLNTAVATLVVATAASVLASSQTRAVRPRVVAIRAGRLFDGKSATLVANQVVLIEGDRIQAVGGDVQIPSDATAVIKWKSKSQERTYPLVTPPSLLPRKRRALPVCRLAG
jgi:hypothetical protein